jgi:MSHA pilin protein MshD
MTRSRSRGFTLIELIIFIVVVGAGIAGILSVMNTVVKSSADPMVRKQAAALADSILEEILLKAYTSSGTGTSRSTFDGVDDFKGLTQADFTDLTAAGLSGYAVAIEVSAPATLGGVAMKRVLVTVSHGSSESIAMVGYRSAY